MQISNQPYPFDSTAPTFTAQTTTSVAGSATSVTLKAANSSRKTISIRNDSTAILYIEEGATATTSSVWKLDTDDIYTSDNYKGIITGIWDSATGNARITES